MNAILSLAYRNLKGAGVRTWLNVITLSFGFVLVIFMQGMVDGMMSQMESAQTDLEYGGGQFWHSNYDPFDPLSIDDSHGEMSADLRNLIEAKKATPVLFVTGSVYPEGRAQSIVFRGIDPNQEIVGIPSSQLNIDIENGIPALIGSRMAKQNNLKKGDVITARWRDADGTFDATDIKILDVMSMSVPTLDSGQVWLALPTLQKLAGMPNEASIIIAEQNFKLNDGDYGLFSFKSLDFLFEDERAMVETKTVSTSVIYMILLGMGLLAIFDTQVLAIFKRRKEIGTLMALGMNRIQVVALFTLEGSLHGVFALFVGAVWGIPLMAYTTLTGIGMPAMTDGYGFALGSRLYTTYAPSTLIFTLSVLLFSVIVVSFLPSRKISKMKVTDAIKGRA